MISNSPQRIPGLKKLIVYIFFLLVLIGFYEYAMGSNGPSVETTENHISAVDMTDMDVADKSGVIIDIQERKEDKKTGKQNLLKGLP